MLGSSPIDSRISTQTPSPTLLTIGIVLFNNPPAELHDLACSLNRALTRLAENDSYHLGRLAFSVRLKNNGDKEIDPEIFGPGAQTYSSGGNVGFGRAHNLLMREGFADGSQYYLALNPDSLLHPEALIELLLVSRFSKDRALVEASQFPEELPKYFDPLNLDTCWASGCCLLVPIAIYTSIGGFDENIFLYCEDVDFSWRALQAGFSVKHAPRALIHHAWNRTDLNSARECEHLNAKRYLGIKWRDDAFVCKTEADLRANGCTIGKTPADIPYQEATPIVDFSPGLAPERWARPLPIPVYTSAESGGENCIDVVILVRSFAEIARLSRCLFSLYSQKHQPIQALLMLRDFDDLDVAATNAIVEAFDWSAPRRAPIVKNVTVRIDGVLSVENDRSLLWTAGVGIARSLYVGFCETSDVIYSGCYGLLLQRLRDGRAAAAFGLSLLVDCSPANGFDFEFAKRLNDGTEESLSGTFLLDRSRVESQDIYALSMTDYRRAIALFAAKYSTIWIDEGSVMAKYILHSGQNPDRSE